jgi:LacI family transcriptional regulator
MLYSEKNERIMRRFFLGEENVFMITIKSIAETFGVSTATVSKALNGLPGMSDELRVSILQYAKENNYIPNMFGRGLKGVSFQVIGVIISDNANPTYSMMIKGIEARAEQCGFNIILCNSGEDWKKEQRQIKILLEKKVDGILIVPAAVAEGEPCGRYAMLEAVKIPYIMAIRKIENYYCDILMSDNRFGAKMAVKYFIDKGHKKIIHVTSTLNISTVTDRIAGFKEQMLESELPLDEDSVVYVNYLDKNSFYAKVSELVKRKDEFTAIFAFNDMLAFHLIKALSAFGVRVPEDVAVIGYDNNDFADFCLVPLTTVSHDSFYLGYLAADLLIERIEDRNKLCSEKLIKPDRIIERNSV